MVNNNLVLGKKHDFHCDAVYKHLRLSKQIRGFKERKSSKSFNTKGLCKYSITGRDVLYDCDCAIIDGIYDGVTTVFHEYKGFLVLI